MGNHKAPSSSDTHHTFQGDEKRLVAESLTISIISFAELIDSVATSGEDQDGRGGKKATEDVKLRWEVDWFPHAAASEQIIGGDSTEDG